jgi:glycosyltransferase involved in cell wall biosynthesis
MKVLMVNKFLYPNGGSETYMFKIGAYLETQGHEVQYFGMDHKDRCVSNHIESYTRNMDFHNGSKFLKLTYPLKTIYSSEARKKIRLVLEDFRPDVVHLNNFTYQLTPSIILETKKWSNDIGQSCKIIFTAHDYNLICPNHMLNNPNTRENCEKCLSGNYFNCLKGKCIHGSAVKSAVGMAEAIFWKYKGVYKYIDCIICCSEFMKKKMDTNPVFKKKTVTLHNFIDQRDEKKTLKVGNIIKKDYVFYFGRFSQEKGINTLLDVCRELSDIPFVFAGSGPLEKEVNKIENIKNVGFQTGKNLEKLIREARFSVCPSEWYENCPFSVMESQIYRTPVLGSEIGGIPELIQSGITGELFKPGNQEDLKIKIQKLWLDKEKIDVYGQNCEKIRFDTIDEYYKKLIRIYSKTEKTLYQRAVK